MIKIVCPTCNGTGDTGTVSITSLVDVVEKGNGLEAMSHIFAESRLRDHLERLGFDISPLGASQFVVALRTLRRDLEHALKPRKKEVENVKKPVESLDELCKRFGE